MPKKKTAPDWNNRKMWCPRRVPEVVASFVFCDDPPASEEPEPQPDAIRYTSGEAANPDEPPDEADKPRP